MQTKISVIVPVYNIEKYVGKCIESILAQTYQNLEIILVDDGSVDNSGRICDEYALKDKRIIVLHKQNEGLSDARNSGLEICTGEYIGFVDGDDWIASDMYEVLYRTIKEDAADVAVCGHYLESIEDGGVYAVENADGTKVVLDQRSAVRAVVEDQVIHSFAWDKLYKRELFNGIKYPAKRYVQDIFTTYRVFMKASKVVCVNVPKYYYYQRKDSIQRTRGEKLNWDQFCAYRERIDVLQNDYPELRGFLITSLVQFSISAYNCLILQSDLTKEQEEHKILIENTLKEYKKEFYQLPGHIETKIRLFVVLRKGYSKGYRRLKGIHEKN